MYAPDMGEHYHSIHGAARESAHLFIKECLLFSNRQDPVIFEIGFGTGLNALLTARAALEHGLSVTYYSIEKYPLGREEWTKLNHGEVVPESIRPFFNRIHEAGWGSMQEIHPGFRLFKICSDLVSYTFDIKPDLVFFDAFSPDAQPELWNREIFERLYEAMRPGGILTTYSVKGSVRRSLSSCGYQVEKIKGPPGKREMVRAVK